jgi:hypothetical protein
MAYKWRAEKFEWVNPAIFFAAMDGFHVYCVMKDEWAFMPCSGRGELSERETGDETNKQ